MWCLSFVPNSIRHWNRRTHAPDDDTRLNFRFRLLVMRGHLRLAVTHLSTNIGAKVNIQLTFTLLTFFFEIQDGGRRYLGFWSYVNLAHFLCWHIVVLELCTKFGSNICHNHRDRRTYAPDVHLMTSREFTSGFDVWSCDLLRMTVMHLPTKFGADIYLSAAFH